MNQPQPIACGLLLAVCAAVTVTADDLPAPPAAPGFIRVHVPPGRLPDVPRGAERYVPMPVAEFEQAVARLRAPLRGPGEPRPLADAARYVASIDERGRLVGSLAFDIGTTAAALVPQMPLGRIDAWDGMLRTADGVGETVVFGLPDGRVALRTPGPGTYTCQFACSPKLAGSTDYVLPLVPALATSIGLRLPAGLRPLVLGDAAAAIVAPPPAERGAARHGGEWRIDIGAVAAVEIAVTSREMRQPRLRVWNSVFCRGRQAELSARVVPDAPWTAGAIPLRKEPGLEVTRVRPANAGAADLERPAADARRFVIEVPAALAGTTVPIDVFGVAPVESGRQQVVPTVRPSAEQWAGGGITLVVDPDFAIRGTVLEECVVVPPETAVRWPTAPSASIDTAVAGGGDGAIPARMHFEQQSASAKVTVKFDRRATALDSARVTTVEVSPGAVLGRAACDVRVVAGEVFAIAADVSPGWFIDSVEAVDWPAAGDGAGDDAGTPRSAAVPAVDRAIDWRVVRSPVGSELRIGLAEAATRSRALGLRITGHRQGVPLGGEFPPSEMDMVRLEGESADSALIDFRVGPEAVIESQGSPIGILPAVGRLAALVEPGSPRGRIQGGSRAPKREARLVQRRPPLDADVEVRLVAREGQLAESFAFTCRPDAGDIDAIVVHFSEPLGDAIEWTLLAPHGGTLLARRLERAEGERGDLARLTAIAESWLIELRPAVEGPVAFRGSRTTPFTAAVPVPLAWVEGATAPRGTLIVSGDGGTRPRVVNRGLRELPPAAAVADERAATLTEFAYGDPASTSTAQDDAPVAELVPAAAAESRAWVWRETATAWCHASGHVECEVTFDIDNRGRDDATLSVPRGMRLDEILIDGEPLAFDDGPAGGGEVRIALPPGSGRMTLLVRGVADRDTGSGVWRVDPLTCAIDMPVLERSVRLMLPPELQIVAPGTELASSSGWLERLFDAAPRGTARNAAPSLTGGFRQIEVPQHGRAAAQGIALVRRSLVASAAIAAGLIAAAATFWLTRRHGPVAVTCIAAAALAALWLDQPFATVARACWWGAIAGACCAGSRGTARRAAVAAAVAWCGAIPAGAARTVEAAPYDPPHRVLLTPGPDGGTALVPESLYRLLAADEIAASGAVRVLRCRTIVGGAPEGGWRIALNIDADRGGVLVLDQAEDGGRWRLPAAARGMGVAIDVRGDATQARLVATEPGRHLVELDLLPAVTRRGAVEVSSIRIPPAPQSTVEAADARDMRRWQCERADREGPWRPVTTGTGAAGGAFDVSRAARVRVLKSTDPSRPLAGNAIEAVSVNDVVWRQDSCDVTGLYEITAVRGIIAAVIVRAHPGLQPVARDDGSSPAQPLGDGRYLVPLAEPAAGRVRFELSFAMPLLDPVGVFEVPGAWLEGVATDLRTVRCAADPDLDVTPELPAGVSLLRPREEDGPGVVAVWRSDAVAASAESVSGNAVAEEAAVEGERPRARVAVRRRPQPLRVAQELGIEFSREEIGLVLECQVEAASAALTDIAIDVPAEAVIDRLVLLEGAGAGAAPVDLVSSRPEPERLTVVVQQPRTGRFGLRVEARLPVRPTAEGRMPLARCASGGGSPLVVTWRSAAGIDVRVPDAAATRLGVGATSAADAGERREVLPGDEGPGYVLTEMAAADAAAAGPPAVGLPTSDAAAPLGNEVVATTVQLAIDRRGRARGSVRFDLVAAAPLVRLRLPAGLRLIDLLVDGREAQAVPQVDDAWELRLHDVRWPRSIVAVFAGEVGGRPEDGTAINLEPPLLEGLPCREVLWMIDAPTGMRLRVAEPARIIDGIRWEAMQADVRERLAGLFAVAVENAGDSERARLGAFAANRQAGDLPFVEAAWERAIAAPLPVGGDRVRVAVDGAAGVTIRAVRRADDTVPSRGLVTVGLGVALALGWSLSGRWRPAWSAAVATAWPWAIAACGGAWVLFLEPAIPGWALLLTGAAAALARLR